MNGGFIWVYVVKLKKDEQVKSRRMLSLMMICTMWGPPFTIAKLVYNCNNYGLWYL